VTSAALLALLRTLGLRPDACAGHSFGEVTALHAAGVLDFDAFLRVARRRGELMAEAAREPGAMLAVAGAAETLEHASRSSLARWWSRTRTVRDSSRSRAPRRRSSWRPPGCASGARRHAPAGGDRVPLAARGGLERAVRGLPRRGRLRRAMRAGVLELGGRALRPKTRGRAHLPGASRSPGPSASRR
jgi:hypothetical protein